MFPTDKVLGSISAMHTLTDNFPMSILDNLRGRHYASIFEFMIEILNACGVDVNEIIDYLIDKVYGIEASTMDGLEGLYDQLKNGYFEESAQSDFLEKLETAIKGVLMGLLSSIFSCSALPILPNRVFDGPETKNYSSGWTKGVEAAVNLLQQSGHNSVFRTIEIHKNVLDPMGMLDICPTTREGRLYYGVEGRDNYFRKEYGLIEVPLGGDYVVEKFIYKRQVRVYLKNVDDYLIDESSEHSYKAFIKVLTYTEDDEWEGEYLSTPINKDIKVEVVYTPYGTNEVLTWEGTIKTGRCESDETLFFSPVDSIGRKTIIKSITINNTASGVDVGGKNWAYLSAEEMETFIDGTDYAFQNDDLRMKEGWKLNGVDGIPFGEENYDIEMTNENTRQVYDYSYVSCAPEDIPPSTTVTRVDYIPEVIKYSDPEYIVYYDGLTPNMLYKTYDMNAFLWYVINKGMKIPQIEYNHMMWDSRISATKIGANFQSNEEWNEWYNSKKTYADEFEYYGTPIDDNTPIYPIIQLEPYGASGIKVHIPAQRYFYPKLRNFNLGFNDYDGDGFEIKPSNPPAHPFNASLYKYNWDYLQNIQILRPKLLLVGLCESLLGFSLYAAATSNLNLTRKLIEAKLSSAIKSMIEANDMEVEDCYTSFSNDEVNMMLEEMLLSRYGATSYDGDTSSIRTHDVNQYIAMLDQVNANTTQEGNVTSIKKMITNVTVKPGSDPEINYGLKLNTDAGLLKKLLWAIAMPILKSIFTPQVLLLIYINFELTGITNMKDALNGQNFTIIINLLLNKIFGLLKSVFLLIKDKIVEILLMLFYEKILVTLTNFEFLLLLERIRDWMAILEAALKCLPIFKLNFKQRKIISAIDEVNYADITDTQSTPESQTC
jgi:hypothetical protein